MRKRERLHFLLNTPGTVAPFQPAFAEQNVEGFISRGYTNWRILSELRVDLGVHG